MLAAVALVAAVAAMAASGATATASPPAAGASSAEGFPVTHGAIVGSAAGGEAAPATLAAPAVAPVGVVDPGFAFDTVGVLLQSSRATASTLRVLVSTSLDGQSWTRWYRLPFDLSVPRGSVQSATDRCSEPLWVGRARYLRYRVDRRGPVWALRFAVIDTLGAAGVGATAPTPAAPSPAPDPAGDRLGMPAEPGFITRAGWGADESLRSGTPSYGQCRMIFVHHTVTTNSYSRSQVPAIIRGMYWYHTQVEGWSDIGYNFLVDRFGNVYQGRYGGVTKSVMGAQVLGFNTYSQGVSVIGTYDSVKPSAAALSALEHLIAWKLDVHHVNPLSTATVLCSTTQKFRAGQWVKLPAIAGHRDANYTACPGNALYGLLPTIRAAVAKIGNPKVYAPRLNRAAFSPNGDGSRDTCRFTATLSEQADWTLSVKDANGTVLRTIDGSGTAAAATWNGRDTAGDVVPDGAYKLRLDATNADGAARAATLAVRVDTVAPVLSGLAANPQVISPNGDGHADGVKLTCTLPEPASVRIRVLDDQRAVVRAADPWSAAAAGRCTFVWNGKVDAGGGSVAAADGAYRVQVDARDAAGNTGSAAVDVLVDTALASPAASPVYFSPNGDGVRDATTVAFTTTRQASVTVEVTHSGADVKRLARATLAAGRHSFDWNGKDAGGAFVASGKYALVVTAVDDVGTVSVKVWCTVDLVRPQPAWRSAHVAMRAGHTLALRYTVADAHSPSDRVTVTVQRADGTVVGTHALGWVSSGAVNAWRFTPATSGSYLLALAASDKAGNPAAAPSLLRVTAR